MPPTPFNIARALYFKITTFNWAWWLLAKIPATLEAEIGGL
jgi:hypothetical protein